MSISISNNKDDDETNTNNKDTDKNNDIINNAGNGEDNSDSSEYNDGSPVLKPLTKDELYFFDKELVPKGETAIIPMDVSLSSYGSGYINNSTGYTPDTAKLLAKQLKDTVDIEYLVSSNSPIVLILHTHATEAYSEDGDISYYDDGGEYARSKNTNENVVAVGRVLAEELNKQGIYTLHSETLHDAEQYKDSYARSEETIRAYLEKYPTIRFVIDLHRDAIVKSDGSIVRPVTLSEGEAAAQVMCVVGSDWGGDKCDGWENNLSLALKLREELNSVTENLCRPTYLRSSTYNQELAPYSLLLEIGSSGNSIEEAKKSAVLVAKALTKLIKEI